MKRVTVALVLSALAATAPASEITQSWRGPFHVRSQFPLDLPTLDLTPEAATILPPEGIAIEVLGVRSNTFEITPSYDARVTAFDHGTFPPDYDFNVDSETTRTAVRIDFGVAKHVQLGFEAATISHAKGFMDSLIDQVHSGLGTNTNDRELKDRDQLNIDVLSGDRRLTVNHEDISFSDLILRAKWLLHEGRRTAFSFETEVKAPTGNQENLAGSGEWDFGGTFLVSAGSDRNVFHGGIGYQALGQPESYPITIDDRVAMFGAYEWVMGEKWSMLTQVAAATSILPGGAGKSQDGPRAELVFGFARQGEVFRIGGGFIENLTTSDNTADFGMFFDLGWRLGM
jgi:hypothetical protein